MTRRARNGGFTLIEIMVAVAVMTVGALGVMALQQAATRGNQQARQMSNATQISRTWLERLRRDALAWNQRGAPNNTRYLSAAPAPGEAAGAWVTPPAVVDANGRVQSYGFDYFGRDTNQANEMVYCTHMRFVWLVPGDTLRAEVRTFWHRRNPGQRFPNCGQGNEPAVTNSLAQGRNLRAVYAATLIRRSPTTP